MQKIKVTIEYVKDNKYILIAKNVVLAFSDNLQCRPLPKHNVTLQALKNQHPEIYAKIPIFTDKKGFTYQYGVCFT